MVTENINNEPALLQKVSAGDEQAFRTLYAHYQGKIFAFALKFTKSNDLAREALQGVFIKLWESRGNIKPDANFEGYLIRIAHNYILNLLRATARDRQKLERAYEFMQKMHDNPETALIAKELSSTYRQAINALPPQKKIIFQMKEEALSHAAIAEKLHISPLTVKKHLLEASRFIRNYMIQHGDIGVLIIAFRLIDRLG